MSRTRRTSGIKSSLAGWLFADLSLVLMILFASVNFISTSSSCKSNEDRDPQCDNQGDASNTTSTLLATSTTSTLLDGGVGGFKPDPVEITLFNVSRMSSTKLQATIDSKLRENDSKLREKSGLSSAKEFGVVLIFGGSRGQSSSAGSRTANDVKNKLAPVSLPLWKGIRRTTYLRAYHDTSTDPDSVTLVLFPIVK